MSVRRGERTSLISRGDGCRSSEFFIAIWWKITAHESHSTPPLLRTPWHDWVQPAPTLQDSPEILYFLLLSPSPSLLIVFAFVSSSLHPRFPVFLKKKKKKAWLYTISVGEIWHKLNCVCVRACARVCVRVCVCVCVRTRVYVCICSGYTQPCLCNCLADISKSTDSSGLPGLSSERDCWGWQHTRAHTHTHTHTHTRTHTHTHAGRGSDNEPGARRAYLLSETFPPWLSSVSSSPSRCLAQSSAQL